MVSGARASSTRFEHHPDFLGPGLSSSMSVTPEFDGLATPTQNLVAADFASGFVSAPSSFANVMTQYAEPMKPSPLDRLNMNAAVFQQVLADPSRADPSRSAYCEGPFPTLTTAYGWG